jgi:hypothetical protein
MHGGLWKKELKVLTRKAVETANQEGKKNGRENPTGLSKRNKETCQNSGTSFLQSTAKIGTQSTMKSNKKTLQKFSPHVHPPKTFEREQKYIDE